MADLVRLAQAGDRDAFGVLYQRFARYAHAILLTRLTPDEAADLVQDVFVQALERLGSLRDPAAFAGWLAAIARRKATDLLRRRPITEALDARPHAAPADPVEARSDARRVLARVGRLPEAYRDTLVMRLVEGLTGPGDRGTDRTHSGVGSRQPAPRIEAPACGAGSRTMTSDAPRQPAADDYLWDQTPPEDQTVAGLERTLAPLAFDPAARPFVWPDDRRPFRTAVLIGAVAAGLLMVAAIWRYEWRLDWPAGQPWHWTATPAGGAASTSRPHTLAVGQDLQVPASTVAEIDVARLGRIVARAGSRLQLTATSARRHGVRLDRGTIDVRVWAPPGRIVVHTPGGDVLDLGCIFRLDVDADGAAHLRVQTGWVQLNNLYGESLVPAGASAAMTAGASPRVPVFDDATPAFRAAADAFQGAADPDAAAAAAQTLAAEARPRDVLTLLRLALRSAGSPRAALVVRAAALAPPPADVPIEAAAAVDDDALWRWQQALPLPPVKGWWRNWRDAIAWLQ